MALDTPGTQRSEKTSALSTQNYRGTRDFYPEDQRARAWLYGAMHQVLQKFGYEEYAGPFLETLELYAAKSSEEIVQEQLYAFQDKGERWLAIRPEMTPTLARMVAARYQGLPRPIRWYSIPTCMRYEKPQRGRFREFDQLNVDIFGGLPLDEDVEVIQTAVALLRALGAKDDDFEVQINHRGLVNDFLYLKLGVDPALKASMLRLLDKRDKMTSEEFVTAGLKLGLSTQTLGQLEQFLSASLADLPQLMGNHTQGLVELAARVEVLEATLGKTCLRFTPSIMRGFDYYTGLVFEIYDTNKENRRALFGGGRYDNLVGAFGVDPLPGIGYGVSDVSLLNFIEVHKLLPELKKSTDVCVVRFSENDRVPALQLADNLRNAGLKVESPVTGSKFGKQIQSAEKNGAKAIAFRGDDELKNDTFLVKWLTTGVQESFSMGDSIGFAAKLKASL